MSEITNANPLGMKSLQESMNKPMGVQFREIAEKIFKWDWIFSTPFEKIIVLASLIWGIYSVGSWGWGIIN